MRQAKKQHRKSESPNVMKALGKLYNFGLISTLVFVYQCGQNNMAAQKDREMTEKIQEMERLHKIELDEKNKSIKEIDKAKDEWKEKYFKLLSNTRSGNCKCVQQ